MKNLLYKDCEVCGTKIKKLQSIWNYYLLKTGKKIKCPKCNTEYKTNKIISFIGAFYTWRGLSILLLIITVPIIWNLLDKLFNREFGGEVWLYAFIILSIIEFIIMLILPLNRIDTNTVKPFYKGHLK